jgi:hypothetical protein
MFYTAARYKSTLWYMQNVKVSLTNFQFPVACIAESSCFINEAKTKHFNIFLDVYLTPQEKLRIPRVLWC